MSQTDAATAITGLHHVRVSVTDLARSRAFYEDVIGFEVAVDPGADDSDPQVREDPTALFGGVVYAIGDQLFGLRPVDPGASSFDPRRVGLDHVSFGVGSREDLVRIAERLDAAGVEHGEVIDLADNGIAILSIQDPDDINLELTAPLG